MSPLRILLQAVLAVTLLVNGIGSAYAGALLPTTHGGSATAHSDAESSGGMQGHCNDRTDMGASHAGGAEDDRSATGGHSPHGASDCCRSDACRCACMHAQIVAIAAPLPMGAIVAHARSAGALPLGRPAPALPHLMRPPIG